MGRYVAAAYQGHDASFAVVGEGRIAHMERERLTRVRHDGGVGGDLHDQYQRCIDQLGINDSEVEAVVGLSGCLASGKSWDNYNEIVEKGQWHGKPLYILPHHTAHLAYAFYTSPFVSARIVAQDGGGDGYMVPFLGNHSVDCIIGDAFHPFGESIGGNGPAFFDAQWLPGHMIGGCWITASMQLFPTASGDQSYAEGKVMALYGVPRERFTELTGFHTDQYEEVQRLQKMTNMLFGRLVAPDRVGPVCVAGGCALNGIAMYELLGRGDISAVWVPPAVDDGGTSVGAALLALHQLLGVPRIEYAPTEVAFAGFSEPELMGELPAVEIAKFIAEGKVVAVANGRAESGPRALGNRSFLAHPQLPGMRDRLNQIKGRESFRPVAPAVLDEFAGQLFDLRGSPASYEFMTMIANSLRPAREMCPEALHFDGTARVQVVFPGRPLRPVLEAFYALTGCPVLLNTSFNCRGEAMVNTAADARDTFARSMADVLVVGSRIEVVR